jgi:acyl carrier protein
MGELGADDISSQVRSVAMEVFELDAGQVEDSHHLEHDLGTTSVLRLEFLVALERRFGVQFNTEEIESAERMSEVADAVKRALARTSAA